MGFPQIIQDHPSHFIDQFSKSLYMLIPKMMFKKANQWFWILVESLEIQIPFCAPKLDRFNPRSLPDTSVRGIVATTVPLCVGFFFRLTSSRLEEWINSRHLTHFPRGNLGWVVSYSLIVKVFAIYKRYLRIFTTCYKHLSHKKHDEHARYLRLNMRHH
jgi:hypothetical protein